MHIRDVCTGGSRWRRLISRSGQFRRRRSIALRDNAKKHRTITDQADLTVCQEATLRHEIIHAFLFESGLGCECQWHDEEAVDWVARMLPRLVNACVEAGAMG